MSAAPFDPRALSLAYDVAPLRGTDVGDVLALTLGNPDYYERMRSPVTPDSIRRDMAALPPGKTPADKHYVGFRCSGRLVAVLDLLLGYPDDCTAWIGFLMTDAAVQRRGVGSALVRDIMNALRAAGFTRAGLGVVKGNAAERFWLRNGFVPDGTERDAGAYTVARMFRSL